MKYNLSKIMKRAHEMKKEADRVAKNKLNVRNIFRELRVEEKALFSACLKEAWSEAKKAIMLSEDLEISVEEAERMAVKETELTTDGATRVYWNIWTGGSKKRAYYKCSGWSNFQNNKSYNFVSLK